MSDEVHDRVVAIIAEQAMVEPETVTPDTTVEDLGLDSLSLVEVVFGIEEAFDISVPFNANDPTSSDFDIGTVGKIVDGVRQLIAEKA
ncbi:MAG: phosphopantetheine-binding protein [Pseudomonadota bacterium]